MEHDSTTEAPPPPNLTAAATAAAEATEATTTTTTTTTSTTTMSAPTSNPTPDGGNRNRSHTISRNRREYLQPILDHLIAMETSLHDVIEKHRHGKYGYVTKEWGFTVPGGLGGTLGGKFVPWEHKLAQCKTYFWPVQVYETMDVGPNYGRPDPELVQRFQLRRDGEQLAGNTLLHEFLETPPSPPVILHTDDYDSYRDAARIFLLLGTLAHLYGNSSTSITSMDELPAWIEDPLLVIAARLDVAPTLSGHFLVQENWVWKDSDGDGNMADVGEREGRPSTSTPSNREATAMALTAPSESTKRRLSITGPSQRFDQNIIQIILKETICEDRRHRIKIYPDCFVGNQLVDVLVDNGYGSTREEAVRFGRRLNEMYHLFSHVTNDHLLMDKHLFYRFKKQWNKRRKALLQSDEGTNNAEVPTALVVPGVMDGDQGTAMMGVHDDGPADTHNNVQQTRRKGSGAAKDVNDNDRNDDNDNEEEDDDDIRRTARLMRPSDIFRRISDPISNSLRTTSGGKKLGGTIPSRGGSLVGSIGGLTALARQSSSSRSDDSCADGEDDRKDRNIRNNPSFHQAVPPKADGKSDIKGNNPNWNHSNPPSLSSDSLTGAVRGLRQVTSLEEAMSTIACMATVPVRDRRYRFRIYKQCFVGSQLIDVLMEHECASTRKEALRLATDINQQFRLFAHVVDDHTLKDDYFFYRFTDVFRTMVENQTLVDKGDISSVAGLSNEEASEGGNVTTTTNWRSGLRLSVENRVSDEQLLMGSLNSDDLSMGLEEEIEFRFDNITMLYPAFGNNHERVNQLIPACMGMALAGLPFLVMEIISAMRNVLEAELNANDDEDASVDNCETRRLYDLLYKVAFSLSKCKEEFQQMSTDPKKRTYNSKYVSIKQTQPLSNGVLTRRVKGGKPLPSKGTTGTQFPYFHILDWLIGRHQFSDGGEAGLVAQVGAVDETFPRPQREYLQVLSKLDKNATLRGFMEAVGKPKELLAAYNHLIECYGGEGGVLQAHCRKLYSYIHNNVQSSTSGTNHLEASGKSVNSDKIIAGRCPLHSNASDNHKFALMMFRHMQKAAEERYKLRLPPLFQEVGKVIYSTSESGGFTTVALNLDGSGLLYEYGDVVKVILPNNEKMTLAWVYSLSSNDKAHFTLDDMISLHKDTGNGWGWRELWEALGWCHFEMEGGKGVPLEVIARYIEQAQIRDASSKKTRWVRSPLHLGGKESKNMFAMPPPITMDQISSLEPVSPRVYSVSGVESERVFLLVSKPQDGAYHHGYESMADSRISSVHCAFSPATFFTVPPKDVNLVCIASGTGISPFVGLVDSIGARPGSYTIVHQCKSSDLFMANSQTWLDFTAINPGAVVTGHISGDRSRRNCPMRYNIRNGAFEETTVLRRHNAGAYYFECDLFQSSLHETYKKDGLNLAYCCGGVKSAIEPLRRYTEKMGMKFEFTYESYGVPITLSKDSTAITIGGTILNLDYIGPIHPGGDQILHQLNAIVLEGRTVDDEDSLQPSSSSAMSIPDHSKAFYELHPHAYNLHRCLRTPVDADSEAVASFLARQAMSKSVMISMAMKYAQVALASPDDSKIVKIATELQASAINEQLNAGDRDGAQQSAVYLRALLKYIPEEDQDTERWLKSMDMLAPDQIH